MKLRILSDLHLEFNGNLKFERGEQDLVILAGDIQPHGCFEWAVRTWPKDEILYIPGNHEFYSDDMQNPAMADTYQFRNLYYSGNQVYIYEHENVVIAAATLWTDFKVFEPKWKQAGCMSAVFRALNDYNFIKVGGRYLTAEDTLETHKRHLEGFASVYEQNVKPFPEKKMVIVSHHGPSLQSSAERYKNNPVTAGFVSNLEQFILDRPQLKLWVHGHVHNNCAYKIGECRVVANPLGYSRYIPENPSFNPNLVVEV